jgi:hypothetical protein
MGETQVLRPVAFRDFKGACDANVSLKYLARDDGSSAQQVTNRAPLGPTSPGPLPYVKPVVSGRKKSGRSLLRCTPWACPTAAPSNNTMTTLNARS